MGTEFPTGHDTYTEPDMPEDTPLSSAGSGSRSHTQHHRDVGDAVEQLQLNVALKGHDHSGADPLNPTSKLAQANTHEQADTDASTSAIHHTLGYEATQAAAGNHIHDYDGATIINKALVRCTSVTRPASPYLGLQIWEMDTNRARVWAQFTPNNVAGTGVYAIDDFERESTTGLGADWEQTLVPSDQGGLIATPDGHDAEWVANYDLESDWPWYSTPYDHLEGRSIVRRVKSADAHTLTDDQMLVWQTGPSASPYYWPWLDQPTGNDFYLRMSDDGQSYIRVSYTFSPFWRSYAPQFWETPHPQILVYTTDTGPDDEFLLGTVNSPLPVSFQYYTIELRGRELTFWRGTDLLGKVIDRESITAKGADNRGWGFGMTVSRHVDWPWTQSSHPSAVHRIEMKDAFYYTGTPLWQLLPIGNIPAVRLRQATAQQLTYTGTTIEWDEEVEDNFNFFNKTASKTDIVIKEPGRYNITAAIQWNPSYVPDVANVVLLLNGQPTSIRQQEFIRGNLFTPGFSQTLSVGGYLRFAANDVLSLRVSYTAGSPLLDMVYSYIDPNTNIKSRIDVSFAGP